MVRCVALLGKYPEGDLARTNGRKGEIEIDIEKGIWLGQMAERVR